MAQDDVKLEFKKLINLIKLLKDGIPAVRVGIIGETANRNSGELNNAEIGFTNEFGKLTGYPKIPARSFLRMPLRSVQFKEKLRSKKSLSGKAFEKALKSGKGEEFAKLVGLVAEETIQEAFSTNGFGQWAENRPYTIEKKGSSSPLIDTGQLRRAITSRVEKK